MSGGVLHREMGPRPNDKAFSSFSTSSVYQDTLTVPEIEGERVFTDKATITIRSLIPSARIMYVIDSLGVRKTHSYTGAFTIDDTSKIESYALEPRTGA